MYIPPRILFICKNRAHGYSSYPGELKSSGLYNSARFVVDMLNRYDHLEAKLVDVDDNNCIDREVNAYKPTHVIIEALWVVPEKFEVLTKLHPNVKWIIRLHSEVPFIANEGIAMGWIHEYVKYPNVSIAANSKRLKADLVGLLKTSIGYLPNFYDACQVLGEQDGIHAEDVEEFVNSTGVDKSDGIINICCFGAIRPLKNQLQQAISAIQFADQIGKTLHFHVNGTRIENNGDPTIKNIRQLFEGNGKHQLKEHLWAPHKNFIYTLKQMDIGMQVSFTETYNIVAADMIAAGLPVVTSPEVMFVSKLFHASPTDTTDIIHKLHTAWCLKKIGGHKLNEHKLSRDAYRASQAWLHYFK